ncbi:hypothetical protein AMATHDRAFT_49857 [Amanita thiersii Skay4041]|uniref:Fungal-type protein kinase domain-containing protein n=1 Tax=Amanita thiersii Skay4041 TaxID=703135 RepID=A0A2A9NJZ5_9AGAR|nr:hypothetical protein AMATHDRAFT_49857 [Amanita thiersii Skay4041]
MADTGLVITRHIQPHKLKYTPPGQYSAASSFHHYEAIIIKDSMQELIRKGRETEMLSKVKGKLGVMNLLAYWEPLKSNGEAWSTEIYLPNNNDRNSFWWKLFDTEMESEVPECEIRHRIIQVLGSEGFSLTIVNSTWKLFESITHAMLGWLTMYQEGYLHRDVSIGNILRLKKPEHRERFHILPKFKQGASDGTRDQLVRNVQIEVKKQAEQLEILIEELGITNECVAVIADGGMCIEVEECFKERGLHVRSGTQEFMSNALLKLQRATEQHDQSPVDDLESFFWVTLWTLMNHTKFAGLRTKEEEEWGTSLCHGIDRRTFVAVEVNDLSDVRAVDHCQIIRDSCKFMQDFYRLIASIRDLPLLVKQEGRNDPSEEFVMWKWHSWAFEGVRRFLELIKKHKDQLISCPPYQALALRGAGQSSS